MEEQQQPPSTNKTPKKQYWRRILLIFLSIFLVFLAVSYGLRTSLYLKARLTPKLAELGEKLDGQFSFDDIHAMGLTGLILDQVTFTPNQPDIAPLTFQSVTVYPALMGMFVGDLDASLVEIEGMNGHFNFGDDNSPDVLWLKSLANHAAHEDEVNIVTGIGISENSHSIPVIRCDNCKVTATLPDDINVSVHVYEHEITFHSIEDIQLKGLPIHACLIRTEANECLDFSIDGLAIGDTIHIANAEISHLDEEGISLNSASFHSIGIARNERRNMLVIENGQIDMHLSDEFPLQFLSGDYLFEFTQLEILHEREANRIGIGIQLREPSGATARIFGGYAFDDQKLAFTFDTSQFDLARFLQTADFVDKLRFDSFPISGYFSAIIELSEKRAWFDVDAGVQHGAIFSPMLSSQSISEINGTIKMKAWADLLEKTFEVEDAEGMLGKIPFHATLSRMKTMTDSYQCNFNVKSSGESADFIVSLPNGFAPNITGYQLSGPYSLQLGIAYDESDLDDLALNVEFNLDQVETVKYDPRSDFNLLAGDAFEVKVNAATVPITIGPRRPEWTSFYDLPRHTAYAFVASEDGKFFTHSGFDIRAIRASLIANLKADKIVRGGSTISQQVIKNLFLNHDKTASRKFQEMFLTWQMEKKLPKLRIFEMYLNLAHWAKDVYGIRSAAQFYFQKNVSQLTLRESLFLASILPNPIIFGRQYAKGKLSSSRLNKMNVVGQALRQANRISSAEWEEAQPLIQKGIISDRPKPVIE